MKAYKCDRCGAYFEATTDYERCEKKTEAFRIAVGVPCVGSIRDAVNFSAFDIYDLCEDCKKSFKAFMGKE